MGFSKFLWSLLIITIVLLFIESLRIKIFVVMCVTHAKSHRFPKLHEVGKYSNLATNQNKEFS